jgi:hypothetical protein
MRSSRFAVVLGTAIVTMCTPWFVVIAATAADTGDNRGACDMYEICYSRDNPASSYQRHYYYSGNDSESPGTFMYIATSAYGYGYVLNHASSMNNRDTACDVQVVDWNQYGTAMLYWQWFSRHPSYGAWAPFDSRMNDHNDAHLRCGHY